MMNDDGQDRGALGDGIAWAKWRIAWLAVLTLAAVGGCMSSQPTGRAFMDRHWRLTPERWQDAQPHAASLGSLKLPATWVFAQEEDLIRSTVSIVRASDRLEEGADRIEILVANEFARSLADTLADARRAVDRLREIADPDHPPTPGRWARAAAETLAVAEGLVRLAATETDRQREGAVDLAAGSVLKRIAEYLDDASGEALLGGWEAGDVDRLRPVVVQVILRLAFASAGRREPPDLHAPIVERLAAATDERRLVAELAPMLSEAREKSRPAPADETLGSVIERFVKGVPPALAIIESFLRQWRDIESLTVEFRRGKTGTVADSVGDQPALPLTLPESVTVPISPGGSPSGELHLVAVTIHVKPHREVRLVRLHPAQPVIALTGTVRVVVTPKDPATGETIVQFEPGSPDGAGAVEVRFEGPAYGLVRLLAMPLASAALREVRFARAGQADGRKMLSATMLMTALGDQKDPRRLLAFQAAGTVRIVREGFAVRSVADHREGVFNYVTPDRRYYYRRDLSVSGP